MARNPFHTSPQNVQELWIVTSYVSVDIKCMGQPEQVCLYGKRELLEAMPPWRGGGEMIK
jgi:selenocysteine lyase/cysteine desulfurase